MVAAFVLGQENFGRQMEQGMDPATHIDIVLHGSLGMLVMVFTLPVTAILTLASEGQDFKLKVSKI